MKVQKCVSLILMATIALFVSSCQKTTITYAINDGVSRYALNCLVVEVNATNAATGFETLFQEVITDSAEQARLCQSFIDPVRFFMNQSGYFFVESLHGWMVAHATNPQLVGTNNMEEQDVNGKFYVREMVNTASYIGYGFVEYHFQDSTTGQVQRELCFVKSIPAAGFFIGSGFHGDSPRVFYSEPEAKMAIAESATLTMAEGIGGVFATYYPDTNDRVMFCRKMIDHVRFFDDQSGYFFMYDFNCVNVAHGTQKNLQGKNLYDYQDSRGNFVIRELVRVVQGSTGEGYYEYWWNNPVTGKEEPKLAYVMKVPGINYLIGSGIYLQ